jgi:hypothetical protein
MMKPVSVPFSEFVDGIIIKSPWFNSHFEPPQRVGFYEVVRVVDNPWLWKPNGNERATLMFWPSVDEGNNRWENGPASYSGYLGCYWWRGILK